MHYAADQTLHRADLSRLGVIAFITAPDWFMLRPSTKPQLAMPLTTFPGPSYAPQNNNCPENRRRLYVMLWEEGPQFFLGRNWVRDLAFFLISLRPPNEVPAAHPQLSMIFLRLMLIVRVTDGFPFYYPLEHNSAAAQMSSSHLLCSLYFSRRQFVLCHDLTSFNFIGTATECG